MSQIIGRFYDPYSMPTASADIAGGLLKGMEIAKQKGVAAGMEKIANGDESGWADVARYSPDLYMKQQQLKSLQDDKEWDRRYKQALLGLERQRLNKENKTQTQRDFEYYQSLTPEQQALYNKLNEKAWTTDLGRAWGILNDPNSTPEQKELAKGIVAYAGRIPEVNQNWSYGGRRGTLEADRELGGKVEEEKTLGRERAQEQVKRETAAKDASNRVVRIDSLIERSQKHKDLLQPYSSAQAELGKWTSYGMSDNDRITRGELIRDVSDVKNDLIARARQNGQTGINTAREIELATKGIESSDWATLVGGLKALKNYEKVVSALEDGKEVSPKMSMGGEDEVIDYTTWMNGAR